ncbi:hypothetical protein PV726_31375 [Streptomyces europaeiscabiei]|uniref:hypothetical protein n=1 Tax=Streptomyces europaeiscabiei TaxID=146819 RepID=UPI0029A6B4B6|nr:hypothetical protein [Streptomyces europaeiscabiei]MDX3694756.1 hypothetical protein [Streptomyces europaeiscabiei]
MTPPSSALRPTAREQLRLRQASGASYGFLPEKVSGRLVKSMLEAGWIYGEDRDGYRLSDADALGRVGAARWKITSSGRWAALTKVQRRALLSLADGDGQDNGAGIPAAAVQVLVSYGLAAASAPHVPVLRTSLGRRVVNACATGQDT